MHFIIGSVVPEYDNWNWNDDINFGSFNYLDSQLADVRHFHQHWLVVVTTFILECLNRSGKPQHSTEQDSIPEFNNLGWRGIQSCGWEQWYEFRRKKLHSHRLYIHHQRRMVICRSRIQLQHSACCSSWRYVWLFGCLDNLIYYGCRSEYVYLMLIVQNLRIAIQIEICNFRRDKMLATLEWPRSR